MSSFLSDDDAPLSIIGGPPISPPNGCEELLSSSIYYELSKFWFDGSIDHFVYLVLINLQNVQVGKIYIKVKLSNRQEMDLNIFRWRTKELNKLEELASVCFK